MIITGYEKYYFLFALALIWIVFAVVQDLKKREVANWLNFSLIGFALAYRAFYSAYSSEWMFFVYGLIGCGVFFAIANLLYYSRVFAGGDAKLLMGLGAILPFENYLDLVYTGLGFIILLFLAGALYSLIYSIFIAYKNLEKFRKEFLSRFKKLKIYLPVILIFVLISLLIVNDKVFWMLIYIILFAASLLFIYVKSLDVCMIKLVNPAKLTEGDWLEKDVHIGNFIVKKSVHGLSLGDIMKLKKAGKKVLIKEGIPFTPAFLIAFIAMVFFLAVLKYPFWNLFSFLLS